MIINVFNAMTLVSDDDRVAKGVTISKKSTLPSRGHPRGRVLVVIRGYTGDGFHCNLRSPFLTFSEFNSLTRGDRWEKI